MLKWKKLRIIKNIVLFLLIIVGMIAIMIMYFDYSAQLPLYVGGSIIVLQFILFKISLVFFRVKITSKDKVYYKNNKICLNVDVFKHSIYPFKKFELYLDCRCKYGVSDKMKKAVVQLSDKINQRHEIDLGKLQYGYAGIEIKALYVYDMLGFFSGKLKGRAEKISLLIMPEPEKINISMPKIPYVSGDESEIFIEDRNKDNSENFEIREFADGDAIKKIHWKLSMKMDKIMVRDTVKGINTNIYVFVDLCLDSRFEKKMEMAVSMAFELIRNGYPIYISWLDGAKKRMKRKLVIQEEQIYPTLAEVMKYNLYEKDDEIMNVLMRFSDDGKEVYNLFVLK